MCKSGTSETNDVHFFVSIGLVPAETDVDGDAPVVDEDIGKSRDGSKTDDEVVER